MAICALKKSCNFRQEMSYKAKERSESADVFPTSPTSDKSSNSLSPTSTLSRGKRRHRKASDKGYGSTNSSLSESGKLCSSVYSGSPEQNVYLFTQSPTLLPMHSNKFGQFLFQMLKIQRVRVIAVHCSVF